MTEESKVRKTVMWKMQLNLLLECHLLPNFERTQPGDVLISMTEEEKDRKRTSATFSSYYQKSA